MSLRSSTVSAAPTESASGGLGLGLAIVDRLGRLLDHPIGLASQPGRGTRLSVSVPMAAVRERAPEPSLLLEAVTDAVRGKLIVIIDDDALVLDGMRGLLESWGCQVVAAQIGRCRAGKSRQITIAGPI